MPESIKKNIRNVPDFPKPGIQFKDITPILADRNLFKHAIHLMANQIQGAPDIIIGIESRGFIFASALADKLGAGFVPVRKPGKLPYRTFKEEYQLEYGADALEMHTDAIHENQKVVIIDDLLATGGTALATMKLVQGTGAKILSVGFLIELEFLEGRKKLVENNPENIFSIIKF